MGCAVPTLVLTLLCGCSSELLVGDNTAPPATDESDRTGDDPDPQTPDGDSNDSGSGSATFEQPDMSGQPGTGQVCERVDLLLLIDDSPSMASYADALLAAAPAFAQAVETSLPPGSNVHVGVTTTSFGAEGCPDPLLDCSLNFAPGGGEPYVRDPVSDSSGAPGQQGRLFEHAGRAYFELVTDSGQRDALATWLEGSFRAIGNTGCGMAMPSLAAFHALRPENAPSNVGFSRGSESLLVLFTITDDWDRSAESSTLELLSGLRDAKGNCTRCLQVSGVIPACTQRLRNVYYELGSALSLSGPNDWGDIVDTAGYGPTLEAALAQTPSSRCDQ